MTECNRKSLSFSRIGRQEIVANFDGGRLTSDAGGLLLREVDRRVGLITALSGCIADPRDPAKTTHDVKTLLAQRIFGIALGYEDLNDHETLRDDPLFALLVEQRPGPDEPLGSPATLCRFENAATRQSIVRMAGVFVDQFIASYERPPRDLVLDFDATDTLYLVQDFNWNGDGQSVYTINTATGAATAVGALPSLPYGYAHHGKFHPVSNLYYGIDAAGGRDGPIKNLLVIDIGTLSVVSTIPTVDNLHTLVFVEDLASLSIPVLGPRGIVVLILLLASVAVVLIRIRFA